MKLTFLFSLLLSTSLFSQEKKYEFDEVQTYQMYINDSLIKPIHYLINTTNNNYYASASIKKDSSSIYNIIFSEHGKLYSKTSISKSLFYKAENYNIGGDFMEIINRKNKPRRVTKLNDTIINGKTYNHYTIRHKKLRKEIRKKLLIAHFITEKNNIQNYPIWCPSLPKEITPKGSVYIAYFESKYNKKFIIFKYIYQNTTKQKRCIIRDSLSKSDKTINYLKNNIRFSN